MGNRCIVTTTHSAEVLRNLDFLEDLADQAVFDTLARQKLRDEMEQKNKELCAIDEPKLVWAEAVAGTLYTGPMFDRVTPAVVLADLTVSGGTLNSFSGSGHTYTFNVTPSAFTPYSRAAWRTMPPQPQPTSSRRMPGWRPSLRATRSCFSNCACSRGASSVGKTAQV